MKEITLQLHPASVPPTDDRTVIAIDDTVSFTAYYRRGWYDTAGVEWPTVKRWAEMPEPVEE